MIRFDIEQHYSVGTTMGLAQEKVLQDNDVDNICIQAYEQRAGKGRHGNKWISPKGNLYLSVGLRPKKAFQEFGQMSFVAALALYDMLQHIGLDPTKTKIKWPNDILCDGLKISGLLLEAGTSDTGVPYLILGAGVNIFNCPDDRTCVSTVVPRFQNTPDDEQRAIIDECRDIFLYNLALRYQDWHDYPFSDIRDEWLERAAKIGEEITVRTAKETYSGIFESVDEHGALLLTQNSGITRTVQSGEVFF